MTSNPQSEFDRLPPHDVAAEQCVLSAMLLDRDVRGEVVMMLRSEDFFQAENGVLFNLINERHRAGKAVDAQILRAQLEDKHLLEEIGGLSYVAEVLQSAPSAAHGIHYAERVIQTSRLRSLLAACYAVTHRSYAPGASEQWEKMTRKHADDVASILMHGTRDTIRHIRDVMDEALERKTDVRPKRIPTGFSELDQKTGGLPLGRTIIIGGRPGSGKSLLAKQIMLNVARAGTAVGIVAIEEDRFKIADNLMSNQSEVPNNKIAYEQCDAMDWSKLHKAIPELSRLPIYVDDEQSDLAGVEGAVNRMATKYGCRLVIVDYLQLINPDNDRNGNREQEVRSLSNRLKLAFKRLNVAGLVTAQLNRASGTDPPRINHLRESGAIEQDGDLIMLLHREDYYRCKDPGFVPDHTLRVDVAKNKDGPTAMVPLIFDGSTQSIRDNGVTDPFA